MNTLELYTNKKIFYPTKISRTDKLHISNTIMEQLTEEDFKFFGGTYLESRVDEMKFKDNKDLYQVGSWMVTKVSPEGIDIFLITTQLIN